MRLNKKIISVVCITSIMLGFDSSSSISIKEISNSSSQEKHVELVKAACTLDSNIEIAKIEEERKVNITYIRDDITVPSKITAEEMENILLNYKGASTMSHLSQAIVDAEEIYGVNALAVAAIVALESGFATSRRAIEDNNLTGYEVYSDNSEGRLFSSQYDSILHTAKHLKENYLTEGGPYYIGLSVDDVQINYCPDEGKDKRWEEKVDKLASSFLQIYKDLYLNLQEQ
ncbi:hypothetical protein CHL78_005295 [Romboutsia weinsteinii]|uniref:Mannosyl-glycoprotein endo-beta-N-acetylglucosamidase-like domain-containing protein n=1 Tax=Romboutsia weinsteinii TaxID=2020949 RepID=A0A371J6M2_9FIRM|nr:glucosaminidase domain-containing protein [Romboutsia weinsteinii]RDY28316.1 hypothetical protein CHL78_005295 [Romboutsia weinsteinii]